MARAGSVDHGRRIEALELQVAALMGRMDAYERMLIGIVGRAPDVPEGAAGGEQILPRLTTKQHAALQMLIAGASNADVAKRFGVTENGAKVYIRAIAKKAGVKTRSQILMAIYDEWSSISPEQYKMISGGLPKDWGELFLGSDVKEDPYAKLYAYDGGASD